MAKNMKDERKFNKNYNSHHPEFQNLWHYSMDCKTCFPTTSRENRI
jgi:hypothetical protein